MKQKLWIFLFFISPLIGFSQTGLHSLLKDEQIPEANWEVNRIEKGIIWKYVHFEDLFSSKQSITVFEIDLNKGITIEVPYKPTGFIKTSQAGESTNAIAAINGSFFNTKVGGSTVFYKNSKIVIAPKRSKLNSFRENAGLSIDSNGHVAIINRPAEGWESVTAETLLTSGPLLINEGEILKQETAAFNRNRHPRTAIGMTKDNRLIAVVVDGRNSEANGMSIQELSILMDNLDCETAMNLDGGGSSTAWLNGKGVVNYPSDNKLFDHLGERAVSTVIVFKRDK